MAGPSLHKAEAAEARGRISLTQLRKLAEALGCEVVYALVPRLLPLPNKALPNR